MRGKGKGQEKGLDMNVATSNKEETITFIILKIIPIVSHTMSLIMSLIMSHTIDPTINPTIALKITIMGEKANQYSFISDLVPCLYLWMLILIDFIGSNLRIWMKGNQPLQN